MPNVLTLLASIHIALWPVTRETCLVDENVHVGAGTQYLHII